METLINTKIQEACRPFYKILLNYFYYVKYCRFFSYYLSYNFFNIKFEKISFLMNVSMSCRKNYFYRKNSYEIKRKKFFRLDAKFISLIINN